MTYKPEIKHVAAKIATLERRAEHLSDQITSGQGSPQSMGYARAELRALEVAVEALRFHRVSNGEMEDPIAALASLVEAVEQLPPTIGGPDLAKALRAAERVLQAWTTTIEQEVLAEENQTR